MKYLLSVRIQKIPQTVTIQPTIQIVMMMMSPMMTSMAIMRLLLLT
jgi:hypothetical protein